MIAVNCLSSKSLFVIQLPRNLVFLCLQFNIWVKVKFIPGKTNTIADALSHLQIVLFQQLHPNTDAVGHVCPENFWSLI